MDADQPQPTAAATAGHAARRCSGPPGWRPPRGPRLNAPARTALLAVAAAMLAAACGAHAAAPRRPPLPAEFMKGMSYAGYSAQVFAGPESDRLIRELAGTGVTWVAVIPVWYQNDAASTRIAPWPGVTPGDASVAHLIRLVHRLGMHVMLKPFVDARDDTWRARFRPRSWAAWFRSYRSFILHYARLAADTHAEGLAVGCEYTSSDTTQTRRWRAVIAAVRRVFPGFLTYAADWTAYTRVRFWNALDYIGIDAYFPLSNAADPSEAELQAGWRRVAKRIGRWRQAAGLRQRVLFTEIGYPSRPSAAADPAAYAGPALPDPALQARAYAATFATVYHEPWLAGLFWFWWDNPSVPDWPGGPADTGYTPRGKPAEAVLRAGFAAPRPLAGAQGAGNPPPKAPFMAP